ncbi:hypothetical protein NDU88_009094 [Pleurodeles waltl]|uniref:Uncharacterized protein n=1 Tax=Pleurodeles waltl TaxID=8319 RepID=A0AAV7QTS3_PLEWA|nr:hypothetical protein NDU88_009094 [Pleurodeles waltl]
MLSERLSPVDVEVAGLVPVRRVPKRCPPPIALVTPRSQLPRTKRDPRLKVITELIGLLCQTRDIIINTIMRVWEGAGQGHRKETIENVEHIEIEIEKVKNPGNENTHEKAKALNESEHSDDHEIWLAWSPTSLGSCLFPKTIVKPTPLPIMNRSPMVLVPTKIDYKAEVNLPLYRVSVKMEVEEGLAFEIAVAE